MKEQRRVYEALSKIYSEGKEELSSEKVELAAIDDLKELVSDGERILAGQKDGLKWGERAEREHESVMKVVSDAEGILRGANRRAAKYLGDIQTTLNKFEVAAKDLGINPSSIKEYKQVIALERDIRDAQNPVSGYMQALQKLL